MMRRWLAAGILVVVLGVAGVFAYRMLHAPADRSLATQQILPPAKDDTPTIETVATDAAALPTGGTPMAQRVAVLGLLNKRNGESREVRLKPGQATRIGDVIIRLRACEQTAPWEQDQLTGAFAQVDVHGSDGHWRRVFSGWLYKERPGLNVVQHPVYDVWTKSCTMSWPDKGPDTIVLGAPGSGGGGDAAPSRSSAKKSAAPSGEADAPTTPDTAADNNAT
jgi:hypothetical protein